MLKWIKSLFARKPRASAPKPELVAPVIRCTVPRRVSNIRAMPRASYSASPTPTPAPSRDDSGNVAAALMMYGLMSGHSGAASNASFARAPEPEPMQSGGGGDYGGGGASGSWDAPAPSPSDSSSSDSYSSSDSGSSSSDSSSSDSGSSSGGD